MLEYFCLFSFYCLIVWIAAFHFLLSNIFIFLHDHFWILGSSGKHQTVEVLNAALCSPLPAGLRLTSSNKLHKINFTLCVKVLLTVWLAVRALQRSFCGPDGWPDPTGVKAVKLHLKLQNLPSCLRAPGSDFCSGFPCRPSAASPSTAMQVLDVLQELRLVLCRKSQSGKSENKLKQLNFFGSAWSMFFSF